MLRKAKNRGTDCRCVAEPTQVFRTLHMVFVVLWAGAGLFKGLVLPLAIARSGPAGLRLQRAYLASGVNGPFMGINATGAIAFGFAAYGTGGFAAMDHAAVPLIILNVGVIAGLAAYLHGLAGHMPLERRAAPLAAAALQGGLDEDGEGRLQALEGRLRRADTASGAMLLVALVAMTTYAWFW